VPDPDPKRQMAELEQRINKVKKTQAPKPRGDEHYSGANLAWRMVIELVAGLGIGFGIGYGLDVVLGTLPVMMMIFTLLGLAAGGIGERDLRDVGIREGQHQAVILGVAHLDALTASFNELATD